MRIAFEASCPGRLVVFVFVAAFWSGLKFQLSDQSDGQRLWATYEWRDNFDREEAIENAIGYFGERPV